MTNSKLNNWLIEGISSLLILLFVYTGVSKLNEPDTFRAVISQTPLIGLYSNLISLLLPLIELSTGLLLFFPFTRKWGLLIALTLMILFTGYIGYMILVMPHLPCSCGGVLKQMTWGQHLLFNICFIALTTTAVCLYQKNQVFIAINRASRTPAKNSRH